MVGFWHRAGMEGGIDTDGEYMQIMLDAIHVCATYKPKFGKGKDGITLEQFQDLYSRDVFYNWMGLDTQYMYAMHKASGSMTSIYRQIGMGSERLFRKILKDELGLSEEDVKWSYQMTDMGNRDRTLFLDARVQFGKIRDAEKRDRFYNWMRDSADMIGIDQKVFGSLAGAVFEVRQGYKSKDSKRQNSDIANAAMAYTKVYLPCAMIMSTQIDQDVLARYRDERWTVITGTVGENSPLSSTYDFMKDVIGYDLAAFFERSSPMLRRELQRVLEALRSW